MLPLLVGCTGAPPGEFVVPASSPTPIVAAQEGDAGLSDPELSYAPARQIDVPIIIGAGPAGLAAAMDLGDALVLESASQVGGRALWAGGFLFLVGTEEQEAAGIFDTPDLAITEWETLTGDAATPQTIEFLHATDGIRDRLVDMGQTFEIAREDPYFGHYREHGPEGGGVGLVQTLVDHLPSGVTIELDTPVRGLVFVDGVAAGVRTDEGWLRSDTVIVASGGFADRADLIALHSGWEEGSWRLGDPTVATGSALDFAAESGLGTADLGAIGSYRDLIGVAGDDGQAIELRASRAPWVWVDSTGTRFVDESATWSLVLGSLANARSDVWAIGTHQGIAAVVDAEDQPFLVEGDAFRCASDWAGLAASIGVDPEALTATMAEVDAIIAGEATDPLGRGRSGFGSFVGNPCAFRPGHVAAKNFGGLAVDPDGRALDLVGATVPGLWAVGEAAGMGIPGLGGAWGFDGSLAAVLWSGWRAADAIE